MNVLCMLSSFPEQIIPLAMYIIDIERVKLNEQLVYA